MAPTSSTNSLVSTCLSVSQRKRLTSSSRWLKMPFYLSPGWLKIDPTFDPVRIHPRF